ncbi:uncharacterized protein LOC126746422 [Anthonomus grandis grandis]|uniref:uncharacterized protein LOC126733973 n=1 Tax=Anthonomus grandis grandis TaxID=2921223 RepID=UPI002166BB3C|nr:uncharacterized protein LOC126733973 [Anthonomus grandis grandis]XP_050295070.1 uncharacterized protein LOC126735164 [Anthonomus grandis grandis]XP_050295539.1 uncharacterized protein LOC126735543 [Anthonomus grandis grandis]XP_050305692.1 uncharacterized protein LOC126742883 [Anthonomus grandis grandis]XP_050305914.1 uncharacterized protein LOC126743033 [Anthonomus grandis grandis]XP_050310638.1 uncharacterized protein LOC126746422 [Anthonomus grandis grandis]
MNVESTFIFESVDRKKLSNKLLVVMLKNLFKFGKKDIKIVQGRVHLYLSYSPRNETVAQKVKGLPVKYLRVAASDEEELQLFLKAMREFTEVNFYRAVELEEDERHALTDGRDKEEPNKKKIKILENRTFRDSTTTTAGPSQLIEIPDEGADEFETQKYSVFDLNEYK